MKMKLDTLTSITPELERAMVAARRYWKDYGNKEKIYFYLVMPDELLKNNENIYVFASQRKDYKDVAEAFCDPDKYCIAILLGPSTEARTIFKE